MVNVRARFLWTGLFAAIASAAPVTHAQTAQQMIQQVVDSERKANQSDNSQWIFLEESKKPKEHIVQWVASTPQGGVRRVLEKDEQRMAEDKQREMIDKFLRDTHAQNKEVAENNHDSKQVDDFLKLLPVAFIWTETGTTATTVSLHFEPAPGFHPPSREAKVFSSMAGDLVADSQQLRIKSMKGHLMHDVNFGGGLLGKLKEGSSFALEQAQVGGSYWQLTAVHVHLEGNALLFKSVSLQQDDERSRFEPEAANVTLDQAAVLVMKEPGEVRMQVGAR